MLKKSVFPLAAAFLFMAATLSLTACQTVYTEDERFCARAAYAISKHIGTEILNFQVIYAEYYTDKDGNERKALLDCSMRNSKTGTFERRVYAAGLGELFEQTADDFQNCIFDESSELFLLNYGGSYTIQKDPATAVDVKRIAALFGSFVKGGYKDKTLLGM